MEQQCLPLHGYTSLALLGYFLGNSYPRDPSDFEVDYSDIAHMLTSPFL